MSKISIYPHCELPAEIEDRRALFFDKMGVVKRKERKTCLISSHIGKYFDHREILELNNSIILVLFHNYDHIIPQAKKVGKVLYHENATSQYITFPSYRLANIYLCEYEQRYVLNNPDILKRKGGIV